MNSPRTKIKMGRLFTARDQLSVHSVYHLNRVIRVRVWVRVIYPSLNPIHQ